jgi:hypothetical protein
MSTWRLQRVEMRTIPSYFWKSKEQFVLLMDNFIHDFTVIWSNSKLLSPNYGAGEQRSIRHIQKWVKG